MNRIRLFFLRWREAVLQAQIDNAQALLLDHRARMQNCQRRMRLIRQQIAQHTPASELLSEVLKNTATR